MAPYSANCNAVVLGEGKTSACAAPRAARSPSAAPRGAPGFGSRRARRPSTEPMTTGGSSTTLHAMTTRLRTDWDRLVAAFRDATRGRIASHLDLVEAMAAGQPAWFMPDAPSVLTLYVCGLLRWLALYPVEIAGWLDLAGYPSLRAVAAAMECRPAARKAALAEGLGDTIFTQPSHARPPEGSAT